MAEINLTAAEMEVLFGYVNAELDAIDLYPGDLGDGWVTATMEVEALQQGGGRGEISPESAGLSADVLAYFLDSYSEFMQPREIEGLTGAVPKLRAISGG